jgi:hypothetical protein
MDKNGNRITSISQQLHNTDCSLVNRKPSEEIERPTGPDHLQGVLRPVSCFNIHAPCNIAAHVKPLAIVEAATGITHLLQ